MNEKETFEAARQALALYEASSAKEVGLKTIAKLNAASRWLLGSLFALHGGAAIALISKQDLPLREIAFAEIAFLVGILWCFAMAILDQIADRKMIAKSHEWGLYWTSVSVTLDRDPAEEDGIRSAIADADQIGRRARLAGIWAMGSFIAGCILAGVSISS
ncbi:MAG: hypothetical protein ACK4YM_04605 [Novosphingobium sp.]